jgi:hypothetical protein
VDVTTDEDGCGSGGSGMFDAVLFVVLLGVVWFFVRELLVVEVVAAAKAGVGINNEDDDDFLGGFINCSKT